MTKRAAYYIRLKELRESLAHEVTQPTDAADIEGAEFRLSGARVVAAFDVRLSLLYAALPSEEQAEMIKRFVA